MERSKHLRLTRRGFITLATGQALAVAACSRMPQTHPAPEVKTIPSPVPFHPIAVQGSNWNYCQEVKEDSGPVEQKMTGHSVPSQEVSKAPPMENGLDDIDLLNVTSSNIITGGRPIDLTKLQIVLVPSGYEAGQLDSRMQYLMDGLTAVYKGVNVQFSYLNFSTAFDIGHIRQLGEISQQSVARFARLMVKVGSVFPADMGAIIAKSHEHFGSWSPALASGDSPFSITAAAHEIAHGLGSEDGHTNRPYKREDLNHEQLSLGPELLSPAARRVYDQIQPDVIQIGFCDEDPLYSMRNPDRNILMNYTPGNSEVLSRTRMGEYIFNDVQRAKMNNKIEEFIRLRPKSI